MIGRWWLLRIDLCWSNSILFIVIDIFLMFEFIHFNQAAAVIKTSKQIALMLVPPHFSIENSMWFSNSKTNWTERQIWNLIIFLLSDFNNNCLFSCIYLPFSFGLNVRQNISNCRMCVQCTSRIALITFSADIQKFWFAQPIILYHSNAIYHISCGRKKWNEEKIDIPIFICLWWQQQQQQHCVWANNIHRFYFCFEILIPSTECSCFYLCMNIFPKSHFCAESIFVTEATEINSFVFIK